MTIYSNSPLYRPDIDGLRAIAIISVVGFHAFPGWFKGGFIGVDVFFVISGYLITNIIIKKLQRNDFNFNEFYIRRIIRIFPSLLTVMIFCCIIGWKILFPNEFMQLGKHIAAGSFFISNIILWRESGYFDNSASVKPLLHLWSLGVEEQFYIIWPFFLWIFWRIRGSLFQIVLVLAILSFSLNVIKVTNGNFSAAFYSPLTRFWELLTGSILSILALPNYRHLIKNFKSKVIIILSNYFTLKNHISNKHIVNNLLSIIGLLLLTTGFLVISSAERFPGWWALLPTMSTAFIILAGKDSWINKKILSNRAMVWLGLISFPLYLWHWPLLSFLYILNNGTSTNIHSAVVILISMIFAWLTYQYVEKPIRFGGRNYKLIMILSILICILGLLGLNIKTGTIPSHSANLEFIDKYAWMGGWGSLEGEYINETSKTGVVGNNNNNKIWLLGDSHAQQYRYTIAKLINNSKLKNENPPQLNYYIDYLSPASYLLFADQLANDNKVSTIIISHFWAYVYRSDKLNYAIQCCGDGISGSIGGDSYRTPKTNKEMDEIDEKFRVFATLMVKSGKRVYFILDNAFGEEFAPIGMVQRSLLHKTSIRIGVVSREVAAERDEPIRSRIINIAKQSGAVVIDPYDFLCDQSVCRTTTGDNIPINKDYDHLSLNTLTNLVSYLDFLIR